MITYFYSHFSFHFFSPSLFVSFRFVYVVSSPCLIYMYIHLYLQGKGRHDSSCSAGGANLTLTASKVRYNNPQMGKKKKEPKESNSFLLFIPNHSF